MIVDNIKNWAYYAQEGTLLYKAFEYIINTDFETLPLGKHVIDEDRLFAIYMEYDTKTAEESVLEAHKRYLDVQYVLEGEEQIGWLTFANQTPTTPYNDKDDYWLFKEQHQLLHFNKGDFGVFYPEDLHMPGVQIAQPAKVKKLVVKVKL
jgi:YhcH/YjgK/YiaL family protein